MIQGLDHAALCVSDIPKAAAFYRDVLEMRVVDSRPPETSPYLWLNFGPGQTLNLTLAPEQTPKVLAQKTGLDLSAHLAFRAPRSFLDRLKPELEDLGLLRHESATGLYFTDPNGNYLEVTCWREHALKEAGQVHW